MRIITGEYKGRRLQVPNDRAIRPTTDKVKEAIFSMLANRIYDSTALDLFAGTGNLGLEALSRGAKRCYFGDNSRTSLKLIKSNINHCEAGDKAVILPGDYKKVLSGINNPCDLIFLDPPFQSDMLLECFHHIAENSILTDGGIIIAEHGKRELLPEVIGPFTMLKERKYGSIVISLYS